MPDHGGTHIDAPRHFGMTRHADQRVSARVLHRAGHLHRPAPHRAAGRDHACRSGSGGEEGRRAGAEERHRAALHRPSRAHVSAARNIRPTIPGVNVAATEWLAKQGVVHFGIDSMRPGPEGMVNTLVHKACLELDITHIESLCNLEALIGKGRIPVHRPAAEIPQRHRLADPGGRGLRRVIGERLRTHRALYPHRAPHFPGKKCDGIATHVRIWWILGDSA